MLDESGEKDPVSYSFNECLTALKEGKAAMWADASVAASMLEAADSPVKGKMGYAHMPVNKTNESGWLWSWNLAVPATTKNKDAAIKFVKWATSKDYHKLVGEKIGWTNVPPGARTSTYELPEYKEAAAAFAPDHPRRDELGQPEAAGREPAALGRHPVRLDPGVPGRRQPVRPAGRRLPRQPGHGGRRTRRSARPSPRRRATRTRG